MSPNPTGLVAIHFAENFNTDAQSKLIGFLPMPDSDTALIVFPRTKYDWLMQEPGWYLVRLSFPEHGRCAYATPYTNEEMATEAAVDVVGMAARFPQYTNQRDYQDVIVLYFCANDRPDAKSKVVAHVPMPPPHQAMAVFPADKWADRMTTEGFYCVRILYRDGRGVGTATPITDRRSLFIAAGIGQHYFRMLDDQAEREEAGPQVTLTEENVGDATTRDVVRAGLTLEVAPRDAAINAFEQSDRNDDSVGLKVQRTG
jgi:hypothetical protein